MKLTWGGYFAANFHLRPELNASIVSEYSCPTGLVYIFIYFMFDIILCVLVEFH